MFNKSKPFDNSPSSGLGIPPAQYEALAADDPRGGLFDRLDAAQRPPPQQGPAQQAGQQGYAGGFIEHYILGIIYPEGITRPTQMLLAALLIVGNLVIYTVWARRRAGARREAAAACR